MVRAAGTAKLLPARSLPARRPATLPVRSADFLATLVYEAFVPVTFLAAVALPLYHAWVLWDDWWRSPIFVALLVTAPMKWVPWAEMSLIWPGLI